MRQSTPAGGSNQRYDSAIGHHHDDEMPFWRERLPVGAVIRSSVLCRRRVERHPAGRYGVDSGKSVGAIQAARNLPSANYRLYDA